MRASQGLILSPTLFTKGLKLILDGVISIPRVFGGGGPDFLIDAFCIPKPHVTVRLIGYQEASTHGSLSI